jgi:hypothetical protein
LARRLLQPVGRDSRLLLDDLLLGAEAAHNLAYERPSGRPEPAPGFSPTAGTLRRQRRGMRAAGKRGTRAQQPEAKLARRPPPTIGGRGSTNFRNVHATYRTGLESTGRLYTHSLVGFQIQILFIHISNQKSDSSSVYSFWRRYLKQHKS